MNLVTIENGKPVTDSLTVAEMFGKEHKHVMRDIQSQVIKLKEAGEVEWGVSNFGLTQYQNDQNKQWYPKYLLTEDAFAIIAMSYTTTEAMKMKVKFLEEFKRMREQLNNPYASLSPELKAIFATDAKVQRIESKLEELDNKVETQITLDHGEQRRIQKAISSKVYEIAEDSERRSELFRELHREIKDRWGVPSYKDVLRKDMQSLIKYIDAWQPRRVTA